LVPTGIALIVVVLTLPAVAEMVALFGLVKLILYVVPLQTPALNDAVGVLHGALQSAGEFTISEVTHDPLVAVNVTLVPTVIPVTVFPDIVPELAVTTAPAEALNAKLYVPVPVHVP
jgi:hypothetical protein